MGAGTRRKGATRQWGGDERRSRTASQRNPRVVRIERRLVEGTRESDARDAVEGGSVEPEDVARGRGQARHAPLPPVATEGQGDRPTHAVVAGDHLIPAPPPAVRAGLRDASGQRRTNRTPPIRSRRTNGNRRQRERVPAGTCAAAGNEKLDRRLSRQARESEAPLIEGESSERRRGAARALTRHAPDGVEGRGEQDPTGPADERGGVGTEERRHGLAVPRSQIDDPAPRRPHLIASRVDVRPVLVRQERPVHIDDVRLGRRARSGLVGGILVGLERRLVGMRNGVRVGHARNGRVLEDDRRIP